MVCIGPHNTKASYSSLYALLYLPEKQNQSDTVSPSAFILSIAETLSHYQCIDLTRGSTKVLAVPDTLKTIHLRLTATLLPETSTVSFTIASLTVKLTPAVSWTVIGVTKSFSFTSLIRSTESKVVQEFNSSTPRVSVQLYNRNQRDMVNTFPRNIVLISTISAVTVSLVVSATLYLCVYRNKCFSR